MKEQYVIKTRNDEDEYLAYNYCEDKNVVDMYFLTPKLKDAVVFNELKEAKDQMYLPVIRDSKYKVDIYKLVQALEYVERGV